MRRLLASLIVWFAGAVTLPLSPFRRLSAKTIAHERLLAIVPVSTNLGPLSFYADSRWLVRYTWNFRDLEPDVQNWIDKIPDGSVFWDIGANVGAFSLYAGLRKKISVLAFEPSSASYSMLNRNIELNKMSNIISAFCVAFSDETKLDVLNMKYTRAGSSMNGFGTSTNQFDESIQVNFQQGAIGFSVDEFVMLFSPQLPTHLKIDIDGIEAKVIRGAKQTLSSPIVRSLIVEIEGNLSSPRNREIIDLLGKFGFAASPKESPEYRNIVFNRQA